MTKVMKSAWDESEALNNMTSYPDSILGDDYVINDNDAIDEMNEDLDQGLDDDDGTLEINDEETSEKNNKSDSCGCQNKQKYPHRENEDLSNVN